MFKHYILIVGSKLFKNPAFSFINIAGLAIGTAAALMLRWVQLEYNFEGFHKNKVRIYQAWSRVKASVQNKLNSYA